MINSQTIIEHRRVEDEITSRLEPLAREYHIAQRKIKGEDTSTTVIEGSLDSWSLEGETLGVTFYDSWRYGGQDWQTVELPLACLDSDDWRQELEDQARVAAEKRREKAKEASRQREQNERAQLARLREKYPNG